MTLYDYYCKAYKVSTDSRNIEPGAVFFALKGERFDGNDFASKPFKTLLVNTVKS